MMFGNLRLCENAEENCNFREIYGNFKKTTNNFNITNYININFEISPINHSPAFVFLVSEACGGVPINRFLVTNLIWSESHCKN